MQESVQTGGQPGLRSIGEVVDLLQREYPSVTASSLRFLERIGLVTPARTSGGHRLYRPEDIERIRTVKRLQEARFTLDEITERLAAESSELAIDLDQLLTRALAGDAPGAARLTAEAIEAGVSPERLTNDLLAPALIEVGNRWESGDISVAQEKAASEVIRDLVAIVAVTESEPMADAPVLLAAAVAGERHVIGLQMIAALLRLRGYAVHFLGANVDPEFLVDATRRIRPAMVLLSATTEERFDSVTVAIAALQSVDAAPIVVVGGQLTRRRAGDLAALGAIVVSGQEPGTAIADLQPVLSTLSA